MNWYRAFVPRCLFTFRKTNIPHFFILGAQKAGTTSLSHYLSIHPRIRCSTPKEVGFFSKDVFYDQGTQWYLKHFDHAEDSLCFEATPEYLYYDFVPERIYRYNRNMKFIVLLRNPVERAYSAWNMFRNFHKNNPQHIYEVYTQYANPDRREPIKRLLFETPFPDFLTCVTEEIEKYPNNPSVEPSFVRRGLYVEQIRRYLTLFRRDQFLFFESRELQNDLYGVLSSIEKFLGMSIYTWDIPTFEKLCVGIYEKNNNTNITDAYRYLQEFYHSFNEELFDLLKVKFDWNDKK